MSKLLKAVATKHRPHIAALMTPEKGYNEKKHLFTDDLAKAGVINADQASDLDGCVEDLFNDGSPAAKALKQAKAGKISKDRLNDDDFINALLASDPGTDDDGDDEGERITN